MPWVGAQLGDNAFGVREGSGPEKRGDHELAIGIDLVPVRDASSGGVRQQATIADGARYPLTGFGRIAPARSNLGFPLTV